MIIGVILENPIPITSKLISNTLNIPDSARPRKDGSFETNRKNKRSWPIRKFLRCRSSEVLKLRGASTDEQGVVEMPNEMKESTHNWLNESMRPDETKITKPMNRRANAGMNQRMGESMKQWKDESMNQWITDSLTYWLYVCMGEWINKRLHEWIYE